MKKNLLLMSAIMILSGLFSTAQSQSGKNYCWSFDGKNRNHTVGLYGGLYGGYSPVMNENAGFLGYKAGVVFDRKLGVGVSGYALWFDKALSALLTDGTYHLQAGYTGVYVEYIQPIGNDVKINFSLLTGTGLVKYEMDKEFKEDLPWYQEVIDQDNFSVLEPGIEFQARLTGNFWIGAFANYRTTSPVHMTGTRENLLQNYTTGISVKYGLF